MSDRPVPRPVNNLWRMAGMGQLGEEHFDEKGKRNDVPVVNDPLVRRYEERLRRLEQDELPEREDRDPTPPPSRMDSLEKRVSDIEATLAKLQSKH